MQEKKPKIVLTGGHLSPLLSIIEEMKDKADILVVGRKYTFESDNALSLEFQIISKMNIPFFDLKAARLQRKFTRHTLPSFLKAPSSFLLAMAFLKKYKPDAVLTFGGYIGLPISVAAKTQKIPVFLHEQTLEAGLTNKFISLFAKKIFISFPSSASFFPPGKTILTGNPLRQEIFETKEKIDIPLGRKVLLIMGGSSGSHRINLLIEHALYGLIKNYTVIHQTGDSQEFKDYDRLFTLKNEFDKEDKKHYIIKKFIDPSEIGYIYQRADLVISRAGANTISELIALQKKAVLIPLPYSQNNEQRKNALMFENLKRGVILEERDMSPEKLAESLRQLDAIKTGKIKPEKTNAAEKIAIEILNTL